MYKAVSPLESTEILAHASRREDFGDIVLNVLVSNRKTNKGRVHVNNVSKVVPFTEAGSILERRIYGVVH